MGCRAIDFMNALEDPELGFKRGSGKCEVCGRGLEQLRTDKIYLSLEYSDSTVLITCFKCERPGSYDIQLSRFLEDPIDWLAQLYGKKWFKPEKFFKAMYKLRDVRLHKGVGRSKNGQR